MTTVAAGSPAMPLTPLRFPAPLAIPGESMSSDDGSWQADFSPASSSEGSSQGRNGRDDEDQHHDVDLARSWQPLLITTAHGVGGACRRMSAVGKDSRSVVLGEVDEDSAIARASGASGSLGSLGSSEHTSCPDSDEGGFDCDEDYIFGIDEQESPISPMKPCHAPSPGCKAFFSGLREDPGTVEEAGMLLTGGCFSLADVQGSIEHLLGGNLSVPSSLEVLSGREVAGLEASPQRNEYEIPIWLQYPM